CCRICDRLLLRILLYSTLLLHLSLSFFYSLSFFFFNDPAPTEIYTLSLHDALPICRSRRERFGCSTFCRKRRSTTAGTEGPTILDRKSTRLNSSHVKISYAVFCLKKKKKKNDQKYTHQKQS